MISESDRPYLQVGYKQAIRALNETNVSKVFLADDCDTKISVPVQKLCQEKNVELFYIESMKELGKLCDIEVGASCAAIVK